MRSSNAPNLLNEYPGDYLMIGSKCDIQYDTSNHTIINHSIIIT